MKMYGRLISTIILFSIFITLPASAEKLDGIAAVVDKYIILHSELDAQIQLYTLQNRATIDDPAVIDSLKHDFLDRMIEDKILLAVAEKDTAIRVSNQDVETALTAQIDRIKEQFPSEEAFLTQMRSEGLTLKELREQYRDEIRNQLMKEKLIQKELTRIRVSSGEVKQFYESYRDSLPQKPAAVRLSHILVSTTPGKNTLDSLKSYAELIRKKAAEGEDFGLLAKTYSSDPSASNGGDLGWFARGEMVPEFENAAYALQPGQISDVVETQFGFHIIKCEGRKGDKIKASHILIKSSPSEKDLNDKLALADSLFDLIQSGASFDELARSYTDDEISRDSSGQLGWFASADLLPEFVEAIANLEIGQVSGPVASQFGYHLIRLDERREAQTLDLKADYDSIAEMARREKTQKILQGWLKKQSERLYVDKRF